MVFTLDPLILHSDIPSCWDPRVYPQPFARAICDLIEDFKATCRGKPQLPASGAPSALETMQMEWVESDELWEFANFKEVYAYLRGAKRLNIPEEWRPIIPKSL